LIISKDKKEDIHICKTFHNYSIITLSSVLMPKYSLSTRNKCVYLLEASETIAIWREIIKCKAVEIGKKGGCPKIPPWY
jgi:hypothetical protein